MNKILLIITGSIAASRCKEIITLLNINKVKIFIKKRVDTF